jgi:hypothetical protein
MIIENNTPLNGYEYWDEYPEFPVRDWGNEARNNDIRLGYWDWVKLRIEEEQEMEY